MTAAVQLVPGPKQTRSSEGIGASEAAGAIGVSDYRRPVDVWLALTGREQPFAGNEATFWGQVLENVVRAHYVEKHNSAVYVPPTSLFHADHHWLKATPDGIVLDPADHKRWLFVGPQVKCIGLRMAPLWDDGVPNDYLIQGVVEMAVTNLPRIDFAVLLGGQSYREFTIWRDGELEADVLESLATFWRLVETDTQPAIDHSAVLRSHLLKQITRHAIVDATEDDVAVLTRWREVAREMKTLKREEATLKNRIIAELAKHNASRMTSQLGPITIGKRRKQTEWKSVAETLRPLTHTVLMLERELEVLQAAAIDPRTVGQDLVQRIGAMRAALRLAAVNSNFDEVVGRYTEFGDPITRRPPAWTSSADEEGED